MDYLLACLFSFIISLAVAFSVSKLGKRLGLIDNPNERSSHLIAMPRGGGAGIWVSFLVVGFLLVDTDYRLLIFVGGCIGLLGLINDRYEISSKLRLLFQLILSAAIVAAYSNFAYHQSLLISILLFLFCVVFISGTANFYNFMDGINGIAGLTGMVGFGLIAFFSHFVANKPDVALMSVALSAGCLGFLPQRLKQFFQNRLDYYEMKDVGYDSSYDVPFLTGCFMFCRTSVLKELGGFDPRYFLYFEDADLTRKFQEHSSRTVYYPNVSVTHLWERAPHKSLKMALVLIVNGIRYFNKWGWKFW